jgi:hypothetical protein
MDHVLKASGVLELDKAAIVGLYLQRREVEVARRDVSVARCVKDKRN